MRQCRCTQARQYSRQATISIERKTRRARNLPVYGSTPTFYNANGGPKLGYGGRVVWSSEDGGARHEGVGSGFRNAADVLHLYAAVLLQIDRLSDRVDASANGRNLR